MGMGKSNCKSLLNEVELTKKSVGRLKEAKARAEDSSNRRFLWRTSMKEVLENADIIVSTLNSSLNNQMTQHFFDPRNNYNHRRFSVCIMDEASQCIEPEGLIPFSLGFNKLVMVGDPEQLPATVRSKTAKKHSLDTAMFSRLFKYWEDHHKSGGGSPVLKLAQQYRMHPRILEWPNRYFYGGLLRPPDSVARRSQFEPLMLLDLGTTFEDEGSKNSTFNMQEASFVGDLAKEVLNGISPHAMGGPKSVGIITFY